ncbi:NnrS family protein [Tabrizicola sp.]|uniref:NnrS family protein n=1 Tax=Tabrizicola sp. TaxID=2005166 RepID=UPI0035B06E92
MGLWRAPHLPLFLLASVWAALVPLVWLLPGLTCDPVAWHRQELVLGFAGAAMGGYLLSALPHWLKLAGGEGEGISPRGTMALVLAWVIGRATGGACQPDGLALVGQALYPLGLALGLVVPVLRARVWRRLPIALAPLLLLLIGLRLRLASDSLTAVLGMALLVALVGGRIVPAFLLARTGDRSGRGALPLGARLADGALGLALVLHLSGVTESLVGGVTLAAALGQGLRMKDWALAPALRGHGDLALLVLAWLWLPLGLAMLGLGLTGAAALPVATLTHALTMGLMGSMVLAVMARAWMGRAPGRLVAGRATIAAFAILQLATLSRLALSEAGPAVVLPWLCAWGIMAGQCARASLRPVPHPVFSARRKP